MVYDGGQGVGTGALILGSYRFQTQGRKLEWTGRYNLGGTGRLRLEQMIGSGLRRG